LIGLDDAKRLLSDERASRPRKMLLAVLIAYLTLFPDPT